mgnify:CR=1 FL=1
MNKLSGSLYGGAVALVASISLTLTTTSAAESIDEDIGFIVDMSFRAMRPTFSPSAEPASSRLLQADAAESTASADEIGIHLVKRVATFADGPRYPPPGLRSLGHRGPGFFRESTTSQ